MFPDDQMKQLPDGRIVSVMPLVFGRGRIMVGPDTIFVTDGW